MGAWGSKGDGPGELQDPVSIAVDALGNVYIADPGTGFVHKFGHKVRHCLRSKKMA